MATPSILLVVPVAAEADITGFVREYVASVHQAEVRVYSDAVASGFATDIAESVTRSVFDSILAYGVDKDRVLLVHREARCSTQLLAALWKSEGYAPRNIKIVSPQRLKKELKDRWEASGVFWRTHAERQILGFDFQKSRLEAWLQQFAELGFPATGRRLASQLQVIRLNQLSSDPFGARPSEKIGQAQAYCYVQDEDAGGSWVEIQSILSHTHPPNSVYPVYWNKRTAQLVFPDADVDEFVLCEDGLWSGSETIRRLQAIKSVDPGKLVRLKFAVVSDFGLRVVRFAIRELGLSGRVMIDSTSSELVRFLRHDTPDQPGRGGMSTDQYFRALHEWVQPHAFQDCVGGELDLGACREIGGQLVKQWLRRKNGVEPQEVDVERFSLGGGGFASTKLFARSVPKVCMPILWLDGEVTIGARKVEWKPLFVDARRVADTDI